IRGVDSSYTVSSLVEKGFLEEAGRLEVPGRPILYKTTDEFFRVFHVRDIDELLEVPEIAALRAAETEEPAQESTNAETEDKEEPAEE
ncbi:MAG: SMC-Scp complex subunit ScpB, partial [Oscillospiraceae bacterium]|nr:SMC-Scp complex subunit ScpB [Oscillospiraceae bacterium]